jgi:hypothetical protein
MDAEKIWDLRQPEAKSRPLPGPVPDTQKDFGRTGPAGHARPRQFRFRQPTFGPTWPLLGAPEPRSTPADCPPVRDRAPARPQVLWPPQPPRQMRRASSEGGRKSRARCAARPGRRGADSKQLGKTACFQAWRWNRTNGPKMALKIQSHSSRSASSTCTITQSRTQPQPADGPRAWHSLLHNSPIGIPLAEKRSPAPAGAKERETSAR